MDLDAIAVFVKVVQAGSFSQAAKLLGMPNFTVSAKVSLLEKQLGVTLLQRTTRKLGLTQAGEAYFKRCVQALEKLQAAESELAIAQREPQGLLRLTAPVELGHGLLSALVDDFLQKHPKMGVDLLITNRVLDLVGEGIDAARHPDHGAKRSPPPGRPREAICLLQSKSTRRARDRQPSSGRRAGESTASPPRC